MTSVLTQPPAAVLKQFPACFDLSNPRPLKVGIRKDVMQLLRPVAEAEAEQHGLSGKEAQMQMERLVKLALSHYCTRPHYLRALVAGAERIDLTGQVVALVTAEAAALAQAQLLQSTNQQQDKPQPAPSRPSAAAAQAVLPDNAPLTAENIVTGRLELTIKFSALPQAMPVKAGMKIGVQTDSALVVMTLPNKAWQKLAKAQAEWPSWVAAVTGKLGAQVMSPDGAIVMLESPAVQVFEKKGKV
ncbi:ProQ/FinO family protein [Rhodoferax sp. 4810]|uniref:ProQ/FinO family protein n=1 Tax=Thiospirillum jenense TaxID=1653858 RepID=A0A839HG06_9GAMM|nr:ProQ/FinO family protein [Thiospirillum jenense]MBB1076167.1 ProQ/FinO family protein [Rhodoferax jenense]MBB1126047.1 ProQ/FinO family protein [Thiospirillum jenense]